jgi:mannose-6-phosphate isomerase-like protein (cupin superfamily)
MRSWLVAQYDYLLKNHSFIFRIEQNLCYRGKGGVQQEGENEMDKVNVKEKLKKFEQLWNPKITGEINELYIKVAKLKGEFVWHHHDNEDEMFYVVKGKLVIKMRNKDIKLEEGEFYIIPKGIEHLPVAEEEVHVMLFEPKSTLNTGNVKNERTQDNLDWI